jgi:hypothetical protein
MIKLLRETANRFLTPDHLYGYGVADVYKAYTNALTGIKMDAGRSNQVLLNAIGNRLYIHLDRGKAAKYTLNIYSSLGTRLPIASVLSGSVDISSLPRGVYIAHLQIGEMRYVQKFIKM